MAEYPVFTDVKEMLEYDCKDSAQALPEMSKALALFDDDYVSKSPPIWNDPFGWG